MKYFIETQRHPVLPPTVRIRCALCVKRCPFDAITMERFELQEISTDGRLYKESYRDAQLAGTPGVAGGAR